MLGTAAFGTEQACTPALTQDVTQAFTTISSCVVSSIVTGGLSNPLMIAAQCGGIVIAQVISIIENEIARRQADAGLVDGSVGTDAAVAKLQAVLAESKSLQAKGAH
jgi:hypothetical protein